MPKYGVELDVGTVLFWTEEAKSAEKALQQARATVRAAAQEGTKSFRVMNLERRSRRGERGRDSWRERACTG